MSIESDSVYCGQVWVYFQIGILTNLERHWLKSSHTLKAQPLYTADVYSTDPPSGLLPMLHGHARHCLLVESWCAVAPRSSVDRSPFALVKMSSVTGSITSSISSSSLQTDSIHHEEAVDERDPKAEKLKYFHFRIHRVDTQSILRRNGDFILRRMRQGIKEKYVVSVRWGQTVKHFPIQRSNGRYCFEAKCFRGIRDLIDFYVNTGMSLTLTSGVRLERPKERKSWELLSRQIETRKQLGRGNFGIVYEATLTASTNGPKREVAAKALDVAAFLLDEARIEAARVEMLEEARIMRVMSGHPNIVAAVGVTIDQEHPMAVMELVRGGGLDRLLRKESLSMDTKLRLAYEATAGVKYIHSKGYLHRDLAARNCLIEKQKHGKLGCLKITDFGLAKYIGDKAVFKATAVTQMPVAWSALESLEEFVWTAESDVWSLGVLIWEILADGSAPYYDIAIFDRAAAISYLRNGQRLEFPDQVHSTVAIVVRRCWEQLPSNRPTPTMIQEVVKRAMKRK